MPRTRSHGYQGLLSPYLEEVQRLSTEGRTISEIANHINATHHARIDYQHVRYALYRVGGPINFDHRLERTKRTRAVAAKITRLLALLNPDERRAVLSELYKGPLS